ncbi:hypothetical protein SH449x_005187 [Pirellulaceae bacterium SH449]
MLNENFRDMLLALNDAGAKFLLTTISRVRFEDAWKNRLTVEIEGIPIAVIGLKDLLLNKQSTGREKDAADIPLIKRLLG